jgi:hypothetical protein
MTEWFRWLTMRVLWLAAFCLGLGIALPAFAQSNCVLPNTLQNGTVADANQVMDNFNTVTGCIANLPVGPALPAISIMGVATQNGPVINASCGTSDSTAALQAAASYLTATASGGTILIACPITIAGTVTLGNYVRLSGVGPIFYPGMLDQASNGAVVSPTWPATKGPAITCTNTSNPCILISGMGVEVDHINFFNNQPAPPTSCAATCANWTPTVYPFIIATTGTSNWNGLFLHHLTFTAASKCIDLEGTPNYNTNGITGAQWTLSDMWFNPCLNIGIREHLIDNTGRISNIDMDWWWYRSFGPVGWYMENNSVGLDLEYAANTQFNNIEFLYNKYAIQFINGTDVGGFGHTAAADNLQFSNIDFNLPCQAVALPNGNGTSVSAIFTNVIAYQDNSWCGNSTAITTGGGTPAPNFFDFSSDAANITMSSVRGANVQSFAAIGHGIAGNLNISGLNILSYSRYAGGAPAFKISTGAHFTLAASDFTAIVPFGGGAGPLEGPGVDGTQGFMQPVSVGSGTNCGEGGVLLRSSGNSNSGFLEFYPCPTGPAPTGSGTPSGRGGYVGNANNFGVNLEADSGAVFLRPNGATSNSPFLKVDSNGTTLLLNVNGLPISCTGLPTGTLWDNANVIQACP